MIDLHFKLGAARAGDFKVIWFNLRGVFPRNFKRPLAAKSYVGFEDLEEQKMVGPPLSPSRVWYGSVLARCHDAKKLTFL